MTSVSAGIVGIYGPPGFGKSQVAIAVGNELKRQEKSVYHFELSKIRTCDELLSKFLYYIHLSPHDSFFTQHLKPIDLFCRTIENVSDNLYFILDDMDNLLQPNVRDDVAGLLKEILTKCPKMTFIVTSRESLTLHLEFFHPEVFRVGSLNKIHSQELVKKLIPKATDYQSKKISDLCENMPFAILLLCKSILKSDRLLKSAITDFKRSIESGLESLHKPEDVRNSRLMGIFESSFQRLTLQSDKDAIMALSTIPQSFDENLAAAVLGLDESKTSNVLKRLHHRSLLEENCGLFKMNKLLASFARAKGELKEMNALFLDAKTRFCNHNISLLGKLSDEFLSGNAESKSAAHEIFYNEKQNIVSSLTDGCSLNDNTRKQAFDVLSKVELFLDTLLWRDSATFNKIYDQAMVEAEECGDRAAFNRMVVAKAFSEVTWNSTEAKTMQLLPSLLKETQLSNFSDVERGKCACYFGIYRLVNGNIERGIELLEFSLSKWKGTTDPLLKILEVLSSQILSLIYESTNDIKRAVDFYQNAEEQCKNVGGRSLLFVPEIMAKYKSTSQEKMRKDDNHSRSQPLEIMIYLIIVKATKTFVSTSKIEQFQTNIHRLLEQESVEDTSSGYKISMMYFHQFVVEILAHMGNCQEAKKIVQIEIARMEEVQKRISDQDSSHQEYKDVTEALAKSYSILAVFQFRESEYEDSLQSHHRALELTLKIFDRNHGNAAAIYHELGVVLRTLKNYSQALEYQQQALDAHISSDANSSKTANSYQELGVTQCYIGEYSAALESHQRALHIRLKNHGDHHRDTGRSYYELGITQWYLEKYEDALSSHKEANRISIEVLGKQNRETADSYHELGKTYFCLKKYREASRSHQHALHIRQKLLGDEHVDTANSYYELGISHLKLNQYDLAHKNHQRAFNIRLKILRGQARDEEIARSHHYLGRVQYKEVEYSQAIRSHMKAVSFRKRLFGENHPETAESYYEWGKTSFHKGDLAKALALLERSLAISESEMGKDHEKTGDNLYQLGLVQWKNYRLVESLSTHQRALDIRLKHLGRYHNKTAKSLYQLGLVYNSLGRFNRAANSHVQARRIRNETLGNLHTETARSYLEEGANHFKRGDYHSAQEALQFAVKITTELLTNDKIKLAGLPHDKQVKNLLRIDHESGLRFYQRVSRMHQKRLAHLQSNNHSLEGKLQGLKNTLADIASIYNKVGEEEYLMVSAKDSTKALNLFKRALDIGLHLFKDSHPDTAISYFNIGCVESDMGRFPPALESHQRALDIRLEVFGETHRKTADSYQRLGRAQFDMNKFMSALESFKRALGIVLKLDGENHRNTASIYSDIGCTFERLRDLKSALEWHQRALDIKVKLHEENHPGTPKILGNMGCIQLEKKNYTSALELFQRALDIKLEFFEENQPDTARCYHNIAIAQTNLQNLASGLESHQRALDIRLTFFGENHPETAESYTHIGYVQMALQDPTSALESHQRALDIRQMFFGENHPETANSYTDIGYAQMELQDPTSALESHQRALDIRQMFFGENHPETANSYTDIGYAQMELQDPTSALESHQRALDIRQMLLGENHPKTADSYTDIGNAQMKLQDPTSAIESHQRALDIRQMFFGENHPETANSYTDIGYAQMELQDPTSALESHQRALDIRQMFFGENHPETANSYTDIGNAQMELQDPTSALESHKRALDIRIMLFGENHPETAKCYDNIGNAKEGYKGSSDCA